LIGRIGKVMIHKAVAGVETTSGSHPLIGMDVMALFQLAVPEHRYTGGGLAKGGVMVVVLALLYALPTMLAWSRRSGRRWRITAVNLLLGWTVIGWIAAMVMTFAYEPPAAGESDG
jgi:hypothetical protein